MPGSNMREITRILEGGFDQRTPTLVKNYGTILAGRNIEQDLNGGYGIVSGYTKFDSTEVPGEGDVLGVWYYDGKVYAVRNAVGGATAVMHSSTGSGWTSEKTGLTPDGKYRFINANIDGSLKMYGTSGVHKGFSWDGTTWTDITTGMSPDTPDHLIQHKDRLFYSFGPSVQFSTTGDPTSWSPITTAGEILMNSNVTGFTVLPGGVLGIWGNSRLSTLSGSTAADWVMANVTDYGNKIGAYADTVSQLGSRTVFLDDRGIYELITAQEFGDFADNALSYKFQDLVNQYKDTAVASTVVREKSQYRVFFADGSAIFMTFTGANMAGATYVKYRNPVTCVVNAEDAAGNEILYFGSTNGYVYTMDSGTDFDGGTIDALMVLPFDPFDSPRMRKRYRRIYLGMRGSSSDLRVKANYARDGESMSPPAAYKGLTVTGLGSALGEGVLGSFVLGESLLVDGQVEIPGTGNFVSLVFSSNSTSDAWKIDSITYDFIPGRRSR